MLPYQTAVAMDYAVSSSLQRQAAAAASSSNLGVGLGMNINPAFAHSWFVPADLCVPYKQNQNPLLEPGRVTFLIFYRIIQNACKFSLKHYYILTREVYQG